jgi:hypothetical protein
MTDDPSGTEPARGDSTPAKEPLRELTFGRSGASFAPAEPPQEPGASSEVESSNLEMIAAFCRAKADAARWVAERQRRIRERLSDPEDDALCNPALADWANKLTDSFYWANGSNSLGSPDIAMLDHVAGCFETVAEALVLASDQKGRKGGLERVLNLVAEAQSLLRQALQKVGSPADPDQLEVYEWVRATAARHRIFLKRFMRGDDRCDPAEWVGLLARIETAAGTHPRSQRQKTLFDHLEAQVRQVAAAEASEEQWQAAIKTVQELVGEGVPPSNRDLRELLLPVIDGLPDSAQLPSGFQLVLREIDGYLATRTPPSTSATAPKPTAVIQEAARLLAGRGLVLIGGDRRPDAQEVLKTALELKELVWVGTRAHQSIRGFESVIADPDVALVLLAIRWASHSFGDVKQFCDQYGKPLVRLPGGYSPNQVAAQILAQCSAQLGG